MITPIAETHNQAPQPSPLAPEPVSGPTTAAAQRPVSSRLRESLSLSHLQSLPRKRLMFGLGVAAAIVALPLALHRMHLTQRRRVFRAVGLPTRLAGH